MLYKFKTFIVITLLNFLFQSIDAKLSFQEVRTASSNILVLYFTSDTVDMSEITIENIEHWKINDEVVSNIYRYSTQAAECDHFVYLETEPLVEGKEYKINSPYGDYYFVFSEETVFCESIKTNQAGYSALADSRYANFAIWLGTGGSKKIEGSIPGYKVYENNTSKVVAEGSLRELGADKSSGDFVYRIDLSDIPEGGPYKIVVEGYGCSYPFGIGGEFTNKLAYTSFRGQYLQRCGCPILVPYPIRKTACHTLIYDVNGPIGEANIVVQGNEPTFKCYGGYHDAGDADRRAYHIINPIVNLMIYEAFPQSFYDGQYDIPGEFDDNYNILSYTNDIPDIIDEAAWGTLAWEFLQNEDGSIHFGTETKGYPHPFNAPMDEDTKKYGTVKTDPRATCTSAGLFMHLARILEPYNPERTKKLMKRAEMAFENGLAEMAEPEQLYFYIQKYLLTGDEESHNKVRELYTISDSLQYHLYKAQGYSLNDMHFDNPAYFYSYIIEESKPTDEEIVRFFKASLKAAADSSIKMLKAHAYPVGNRSDVGGWGHNVRQPQYAGSSLLYWGLTKEQKYLNVASELMDWKLGLNPQGISYVTGLGFRQVNNPHDRECGYSKLRGWDNKPGITVFGPGTNWYGRTSDVIPPEKDLSKERLFVDDIRAIYYTEFTIFETMSHDAFYTILSGGGKWNGEDPYNSTEKPD